jgi:ABC-type multidrug transport system ATPase subunit
MLAIFGPSGTGKGLMCASMISMCRDNYSSAGKSVLLKSLAGRKPTMAVVGDYFINGLKVDLMDHNTRIAYVAQYSMEIGELTPRETIRNRVLLKNPHLDSAEVTALVNQAIENFSLETCADTKTGVTSGGQKKRIDLAAEFVSKPSIILLDGAFAAYFMFDSRLTMQRRADKRARHQCRI